MVKGSVVLELCFIVVNGTARLSRNSVLEWDAVKIEVEKKDKG